MSEFISLNILKFLKFTDFIFEVDFFFSLFGNSDHFSILL